MAKIVVITNMENHFIGLQQASQRILATEQLLDKMEIIQINDQEVWNKNWENKIKQSAFVLTTWMGTGLCCDFLKKASTFMQNNQKKHLFAIIDPGDDALSFGITSLEIERIGKYLSYGGLDNYINLCAYLMNYYLPKKVSYLEPQQLPWCGIYHPKFSGQALTTKDFFDKIYQKDKPVVGLVFAREDWLWDNIDYQNSIITALEQEGCNVLALFSSNLANSETGAPALGESIQKMFYYQGQVAIDVLINPFVFSLTVTGFASLKNLQELGVPILQVHNMYMDYKWWEASYVGLTANEVAYAVAMPEFDGVIHAVPTSTREQAADGTHYRYVLEERIKMLARKTRKWAMLAKKPNSEKKVAIVFHNYPPTNSNIGSAACIDSIESVRVLLGKLADKGYKVGEIPTSSQEFIEEITAHATNDRRFISEKLLDNADATLSAAEYQKFYNSLPEKVQQQLQSDWGDAPGEVFNHKQKLIVPGVIRDNVFITVQPPRGFGDDPGKIYHSPDCAPTHHYLGFYYWLRDVWQADAMIHVGTHGNLEWLPGKGNAMSAACYSDIATGDMPNIYPYWITCVGEGIQAKRRSAACLISYLSAPMSTAGTYEELAELEQLLEEYCHFANDESAVAALPAIEELIHTKVQECNLQEDVPTIAGETFLAYVGRLHVYMTDIKNMQISTGLHILGEPPVDQELIEYLLALTKLENGEKPSLLKSLAQFYGYEYYQLLEASSQMLPSGKQTYGQFLDELQAKARELLVFLQINNFEPAVVEQLPKLDWIKALSRENLTILQTISSYICTHIAPSLLLTTQEQDNIMAALNGEYIEPSASGAPTSGGADLLPTGRNFYSIDPRTLPTKVAWEIGKKMADDVINRFIQEEGHYPESVGIILWATSNLRNHGQCIAEFLYLMGLRPVWQAGSGRVVGLEVMSLAELQRPRIDVTGRISGLFRDSLPASVTWLDTAVDLVAKLEEDLELNFVRKHVLQESGELIEAGLTEEEAWREASYRIFGDPPGAHGAGIGAVLEAKNWENVDDLAAVYTRWGGHVYGKGAAGEYSPERFKRRMSQLEITLQNVDHRESSMLSGDDYNNYRGGMVAAVRSYRGEMPKNYVSDSSDRKQIQVRSLNEELKRWFRGEAINPKYIEGMKKHGYKGAGDLATYVAVSYQWDATSEVMEDWMYEKYVEKYALDPKMQEWMKAVNPWALHRIAEVLLEAEQRGLWNAKAESKAELQKLFLSLEGELEEKQDN